MPLLLACLALAADPADWEKQEAVHLKNIRQVTHDFVRAGEGYFSPDGKQIIFQAEEKSTGNPYYQIFTQDLATGRVTRVSHTPGRFLPAYRHDAGSANERSEVWIDHGGQLIVARQVVGVLARRVVCRVQNGAEVRAGERFGIMKFGSRMDIFLPLDATIRVKIGDFVRGGETVIAVLHSG